MYKAGQWNAVCDVCGFEFKSGEMRKRWDGLMVCSQDFEHDHPQKYLKVRAEQTSVPWVRSEPEDVFVTVCDLWTSSGYAEFGTADCAQADAAPGIERLIELFQPGTTAIAGIGISGYAIAGVH